MAVENNAVTGASVKAGAAGPRFGYRLLYRLGFKPWDNNIVPMELAELVEGPQALPPGRALDLGCGTGTQAIYLTQHGWQVTGVDFVGRALDEARRRAASAGVTPAWVEGDVTRLPELGIGAGYNLLLDAGCFHGLTADQRAAYAAGAAAVSASGAKFLLFGFAYGRRGPAPRGVSREEVVSRFAPDWRLLWTHPAREATLPPFLRGADPAWYCLRRA